MSRTRHNLPDNLNPTGDKCYPLFIPDDPEWNRYIIRAIRTLTFDRHWERDENNGQDAIAVRNRWNESTYIPLIDALQNDTPCEDDRGLGSCFRMDTTTDVFSFYPNDPFTDPANKEGNLILTQMKWKRFSEIGLDSLPIIGDFAQSVLETVTGYYPNDIILTFDPLESLNPIERLGDIIGQFTNFWLPYVRVEIEGAGQIEIEVLNFPFGGYVMLIPDLPVDEDFNIDFSGVLDTVLDFVDDGLDLPKGWISLILDRKLPVELIVSQIQEFEFDTPGKHTIHAVFCPRPSLTPPFLNPFGGIREIEACGEIKVIGATTGNLIDKSNLKQAEMTREGFIMGTTDDFYDALIRYETEKANRWLFASEASNIVSGIEVDPDTGEVTVKPDILVQTPDVGASQLELNAGGAYGQAAKFAKLFADMNSQKPNFALATIQNVAQFYLDNFDANSNLATHVQDYINGSANTVVDADDLAERIFCSGNFYSGVRDYALSLNPPSETTLNFFINFAQEIPSQTAQRWYSEGQAQPTLDYLQYDCTPRETLTFKIQNDDTSEQFGNFSAYANSGIRRIRVKVAGQFTDGTEWRDIAYKQYNADPNPVRENLTSFYLKYNNDAANWNFLNPPAGIAYQESHTYSWDVEIIDEAWSSFRWRIPVLPFTDSGNELTVSFTDLGLV